MPDDSSLNRGAGSNYVVSVPRAAQGRNKTGSMRE